MAKGSDRNHVSFWFWLFALFVTAIPCIGFIMVIVWAFVGDNESRKNYFRAVLAWLLIIALISVFLAALGFWPLLLQEVDKWFRTR